MWTVSISIVFRNFKQTLWTDNLKEKVLLWTDNQSHNGEAPLIKPLNRAKTTVFLNKVL